MLNLKCCLKYQWLYKSPSYIFQYIEETDQRPDKHSVSIFWIERDSKIMGRIYQVLVRMWIKEMPDTHWRRNFEVWRNCRLHMGEIFREGLEHLNHWECNSKNSWATEYFFPNHCLYLPSCQEKTNILFFFDTTTVGDNMAKLPSIGAY